jgi:hypothetical protein
MGWFSRRDPTQLLLEQAEKTLDELRGVAGQMQRAADRVTDAADDLKRIAESRSENNASE